jgi:hypothetical protein
MVEPTNPPEVVTRKPDVTVELEWVHGYNAQLTRNSLAYNLAKASASFSSSSSSRTIIIIIIIMLLHRPWRRSADPPASPPPNPLPLAGHHLPCGGPVCAVRQAQPHAALLPGARARDHEHRHRAQQAVGLFTWVLHTSHPGERSYGHQPTSHALNLT